jgi:hypothetical protein
LRLALVDGALGFISWSWGYVSDEFLTLMHS